MKRKIISNIVSLLQAIEGALLSLKKRNSIFEKIYHKNSWKSAESRSGTGSEFEQTKVVVASLVPFLQKYQVTSLLDVPCGDWNWMQRIQLRGIAYVGGDIVKSLIDNNISQFGSSCIRFVCLDLVTDPLPEVDCVFCRDCLVHLSNSDIINALQNIKRSRSRYLLTTDFPDCFENRNIATGQWRPINFTLPPFNFPAPLDYIIEDCTDVGATDKRLALWSVEQIDAHIP